MIVIVARDLFMRKVRLVPGPLPTPCWVWRGALKDGYGRFTYEGRTYRAHRVAYEAFVGEIAEHDANGKVLVLDHKCRNRACTNPEHVEIVTQRVNILRGANHVAARARVTHCPAGHAYDEANTYRDDLNRRYCRTCRRERARNKRAAA